MSRMSDVHWISTDEAEDVAGSVRHAIRCFAVVNQDEQAWKWIMLALHSALQGACVCHLVTTAPPIGIVCNVDEWLAYYEQQRNDPNAIRPKTRLMTLPDLLKATRKDHSAGDRSNTHGIPISDQEYQWIKRLHDEIRNQFVHFQPQGWSIEVSGLHSFAKVAARIIGDIEELGYAFRHKGAEWRNALRSHLLVLASFA